MFCYFCFILLNNIAGKFTDRGIEWKHEGKKKVIKGILTGIKKSAA